MKLKLAVAVFLILLCTLCKGELDQMERIKEKSQLNSEIKDEGERSGINIVIAECFLNEFLKGILPKIWDMINQQIIVKGKTISINIPGLFTVYFNILELRLSDVYYNTTSTNVNLIESNNTIGFHIDNSSIHFNLTYKLYLDPKLLEDSGKIEYGTDHFKMDLIFGMKPRPDDPKKMIITISENSLYFDTKFTFLNLTNVNNFGNFMMDIAKVFKLPIISLVEGMLFYFLY